MKSRSKIFVRFVIPVSPLIVIPAKAGIQRISTMFSYLHNVVLPWIPDQVENDKWFG